MKLSSIVSETEFTRLRELDAPMLGATPTATPGATTLAPGQQVAQDPAAQQKMMAQQALDRANKKKEIQELIRQKQKELQDLQKQMATIK
jgi:hypothetical protein